MKFSTWLCCTFWKCPELLSHHLSPFHVSHAEAWPQRMLQRIEKLNVPGHNRMLTGLKTLICCSSSNRFKSSNAFNTWHYINLNLYIVMIHIHIDCCSTIYIYIFYLSQSDLVCILVLYQTLGFLLRSIPIDGVCRVDDPCKGWKWTTLRPMGFM